MEIENGLIKNAAEAKAKLDFIPKSFWLKVVIGVGVIILFVAFGLGVLVGRQIVFESCADSLVESIGNITLNLK